MFTFRYLAAPALGLSLALGAVGCANDRHDEIPTNALMAVEGDERLTYTAPEDGKVYIYDVNDDRMVYSGDVEKGDVVSLDPDEDRVTVDGRTAFEDGLDNGNRHRIFFDAEPRSSRTVIEKTTVSEPRSEGTVIEEERTVRKQPLAEETVVEERTVTERPAGSSTVVEEQTTIKRAD